jgi:hypothetical protein
LNNYLLRDIMMRHRETDWVEVGEIGVDAGLCWVGDPCYILHKKKGEAPNTLGKDWYGFCNELHERMNNQVASFPYGKNDSRDGLGVVVRTGHGDGCYPVYVKYRDGIVAEVKVVFDSPYSEDEEFENE